MNLNELKKIKGNRKKAKIIGRGRGSGKGSHTVGKGSKGQNVRSGHTKPFGFEGGQTPLYKRIPTLGGFKRSVRMRIISLPMGRLNVFEEGVTVIPADLAKEGLIKVSGRAKVKLLVGSGDLKKKLVLKGFLFSEAAKEKLEKSGTKIL